MFKICLKVNGSKYFSKYLNKAQDTPAGAAHALTILGQPNKRAPLFWGYGLATATGVKARESRYRRAELCAA